MSTLVVKAREIESEEEIQRIYNWMDDIELSRPRKSISRDFADGLLIAEVICQYFPRLVELHNYSSANSYAQKQYNWNTMNKKVLRKMGFQLHPADIDDVIKATPGAVEKVLVLLQHYMARYKRQQDSGGVTPGGLTPNVSRPQSALARGPADDSRIAAGRGAGSAVREDSKVPTAAAVQGTTSSTGNGSILKSGSGGALSRAGIAGRERAQGAGAAVPPQQAEQEQSLTIQELRETILLMSEKIKKLEQLVRIKDAKIDTLNQKLADYQGVGAVGGGAVGVGGGRR
eukprot:CAMPEP_0178995600 /NCGR_PEP_ID=MMETSP0795-20121207/7909_1 /TAXON_ID=88552 /ORGANISM="Amoebophrya sp., Strain Ameob2" /LENGTH=286 /DNA_ID=CAMNT_0020687909 /DNA_START=151 /DNA_END=1011 /DNA_ORIENTATION=-